MLNIMFGQSKYYVDSLSENTKRGLREKVRRGEFPSHAPIGYLNDYRTKKIIVDRERAPLVKKVFQMYATGEETLDTLRQFLGECGVCSGKAKLVGRSFVSRLLSNPIYYGHFLYAGEVHEGKHEPIISKDLFDRADAVLNRRWRHSPTENTAQPKAFTGLLRCASCGMMITAERKEKHQKNGNTHSYTYYRCTKKNKTQPCSQPFIREEVLDVEITALLKPYSLPADWADEMLKRVNEEKSSPPKPPSSWPDKSAQRLTRSINASKNFSTHSSTA